MAVEVAAMAVAVAEAKTVADGAAAPIQATFGANINQPKSGRMAVVVAATATAMTAATTAAMTMATAAAMTAATAAAETKAAVAVAAAAPTWADVAANVARTVAKTS
jgi:hypothetical protein